MVCVPCVIVPVLLLIWRFLIQPFIMKLWNAGRNEKGDNEQGGPPELVQECKDGVCTLAWKNTKKPTKIE